jgi:hypothetical protein
MDLVLGGLMAVLGDTSWDLNLHITRLKSGMVARVPILKNPVHTRTVLVHTVYVR